VYLRTLGLIIARNDREVEDMPQTRRAKQAGSAALERLQASIEAAETALKDLQREVSRNNRALLKDIDTTLKATRRNLNRSRRRITKDLQQIQHALVKGKAAARPAPKRAASVRRVGAGRSSKAARPTSSTKRSTKVGKAS
jgi:chromosome segregation ATPase